MSVHESVELVGTSTDSWEKAAASAIQIAARTIPDMRAAKVEQLDLQIIGEQINYRTKLKVSCKVEDGV